jgi:hypothetical protein
MNFNPYRCKFTLLARLPPEIQNMIRQIAVNDVGPRIVEVKGNIEPNIRRSDYRRRRQFTSPCPIPGVLHACRASCSLALRRWRLSFAARYHKPKILFDFSCNALFLAPEFGYMKQFVESISSADRAALKSIAFDIVGWANDNGWDLGASLQEDFPAVNQLSFPEKDIDAERKEEYEERRAKRLRAEHRLLNAPQRRRRRPKRDPRKTIIEWYKCNIPTRRPARWVDATMQMLEQSYNASGYRCPKIKRVDYIKRDLAVLVDDEDQARLDWIKGQREFEKVWARFEAEQLTEAKQLDVE